MFYLADGRISFYDIYDLYYELFNESLEKYNEK